MYVPNSREKDRDRDRVRGRQRERERVCVYVRERGGDKDGVREREEGRQLVEVCVCVCEYKPSNETTVVVGGLLEYGGEEKKTVYALAHLLCHCLSDISES